MKDFYEDYWAADHPPPMMDPLTPVRQRLLWRYVERDVQAPVRLLDAGAGEGGLIQAANARGIDASGLEVSTAAIAQARKRMPDLQIREHSIEELPWPMDPSRFDVVTGFEVIEHLLRPRRLLQGAHASLRPRGHLALTTPYHGLVKNLVVAGLAFDRHFDVTGGHVRFFTDRALRQLLEAEGFEVVEVTHYGRAPLVWAGVFVWARKT